MDWKTGMVEGLEFKKGFASTQELSDIVCLASRAVMCTRFLAY